LSCVDPNAVLADRVGYYKNSMEGVQTMYKIVEGIVKEIKKFQHIRVADKLLIFRFGFSDPDFNFNRRLVLAGQQSFVKQSIYLPF